MYLSEKALVLMGLYTFFKSLYVSPNHFPTIIFTFLKS